MGMAFGIVPAARAEIDYDTRFEGVEDDIESDLESVSQLVTLADKAPDTRAMLERRARDDVPRLLQAMQANGYWDAEIRFDVTQKSGKDDYLVTVHVEPGARYTLAPIVVLLENGAPPPQPELATPESAGLLTGAPAVSAPVIAGEDRLVHAYAVHGYPYARIARRTVEIDVATKRMHVTYVLDPGQRARYGATQITGLDYLDPAYVERRIKWQEGASYDQSQVDDTRQTLVTTGLFGTVTVVPSGAVAADGTVPMKITLVERPLHTIGAGASYDTSLGLEANVSWEDRDIFGGAEDFSVTAIGGQSDSSLNLKFRRPDALWTDQDFVAAISAANELEDAFRALDQKVSLGFEENFTPQLTGGYSILAEHARIDEKIDYRVYTLVGLPLFLRENDTDDLMNPTRGYRAALDLTPYLRPLGSELTYVQARLAGSTYFKLDPPGDYILALQGIVGASCCASLDSMPKDHRFFAGGGGSVRGFGYQKAGPLDQYSDPIGGRSLLVGSAEVRVKITDTIGIVPFVDAGSDYATPLPKLDGKLYFGAGIGLRYFTAIGPLRLDVATPLNPHSEGDSPIQIYVSLGQAF